MWPDVRLPAQLAQRVQPVLRDGRVVRQPARVAVLEHEERVAEDERADGTTRGGSGGGGGVGGGGRFDDIEPGPRRPAGHDQLVQVADDEVTRRVHAAVEAVLERDELAEVVYLGEVLLHVRPHVDGDGDLPLLDIRHALSLQLAQEARHDRRARVVVEDEPGGAEQPIHFHHLHEAIAVGEVVVQRGDANGEVVETSSVVVVRHVRPVGRRR